MGTRSYAQLESSEGEYQTTCPISELVEITAPLAGIDPEDLRDNDDFCRFVKPEFSIGHQRFEYKYTSRERNQNQCVIIHDIIRKRINLVEEVFSFDHLLSMDEIFNLPISEKEKLKMFEELKDKREKIEKSDMIISQWRESIYELLGNEGESEENSSSVGYRWEDLTDEVLLYEVKKFHRALDRQKLGMEQEESCPSDFSGIGRLLRSLRQD
jgi:hypothetical protein